MSEKLLDMEAVHASYSAPQPVPVPQLEADAIHHRRAIFQQADASLKDGIKQVLQRLGAPEDWGIQILPDGSMVAIAPVNQPAAE